MRQRGPSGLRHSRRMAGVVAVCAVLQLGAAAGIAALLPGSEPAPAVLAPPAPAAPAAPAAPGAPGAAPSAAGDNAPAPAASAAELLDRRARAFRDRDRAAFLAGVDPAQPQLREAQARMFDNAAAVPFASFAYEYGQPGAFEVPPARRAELAAPVATASVDLLYRLTGQDPAPVRVTQYLTFVVRGNAWYLAGENDGAAAGRATPVQLWDLGPVTAVGNRAGLVLGIGTRDELAVYAREAETAVPDVTAVWGADWAGSAVVVVPATQDQMARLLGAAPEQYTRIAAVATGPRGPSAQGASADRVIVNPEAFAALGDVERRVVMTHEIAHVAARAYTRTWTPTWLSEGFADYAGYLPTRQPPAVVAPELAADVRAGRLPATLPADDRFGTTQENLPQAYEMGWLACRMIAETRGADKLVELYRELGAGPPPGAPEPEPGAAFAAALMKVLGAAPEEFTAEWARYLAENLA